MTVQAKAWPIGGYTSYSNTDLPNGIRTAVVMDGTGRVGFSENMQALEAMQFASHTVATHAAIQFCEGTAYDEIKVVEW